MKPELYQAMARYNRVMNEKIYGACGDMSDEDRRADRGAFFGSIHATLDHILWGDMALLARLTEPEMEKPTFGEPMADSFEDLSRKRRAFDDVIDDWAAGLTEEFLAREFTWQSGMDGKTRTTPCWLFAQHVFNHQAHHRGQVTTLLAQAGVDIGVTDLPRLV